MSDVFTAINELRPAIRARADEIEKARRLPADLARSLARAGAFHMLVPREVGGLELPPAVALRAIESAGAADASVGWCVMIGATTGLNAAYLPVDTAREIFASPDVITGGVFAPMGRAVRDGGDYVLDGRWQWASGSANCDWLLAGAIVFENGAPRKLADGTVDDRKFIFPASQATLGDTWHVTGLCGTGSGEMAVANVRVPARRTTSYLESRPAAAGALYAFPVFGLLALGIEYAGPIAAFQVPGLGRSSTTDWDVHGEHIAERCGLFVIICLGETLLINGATFAEMEWTGIGMQAFMANFLGTVAMWWIYFHIGYERAAHTIEASEDPGQIARVAFTYAHIPIIAGIVLTAVAAELVIAHPGGHTGPGAAAAILGGPGLFLLGTLWFKKLTAGWAPLSHLVGLGLMLLLALVSSWFTPLGLTLSATAVLMLVAAWEHRSLGRGHA